MLSHFPASQPECLLVPTAEGLLLLEKELRARWLHQYFISKSYKSPWTSPVALTSITNWFGEEKGFKKRPLDPKTLHGKNVRVMLDQLYRENSLRWAVCFSPHSGTELRAAGPFKVGNSCFAEILKILVCILGIYSFHIPPVVIVQLWYVNNDSLLPFPPSQLSHCCLCQVPTSSEHQQLQSKSGDPNWTILCN